MANSYWQTAKLKVQRRSGFNKDHYRAFTSNVGTLTPLLCDEVIPNSKVNLRINLSATLPPLASETYMKCDYKVEAFFVPLRLLYGGFESWLTQQDVIGAYEGATRSVHAAPPPIFGGDVKGGDGSDTDYGLGSGTLADYLGFSKIVSSSSSSSSSWDTLRDSSVLPFMAYHKVWNDWYRNARVTDSIFTPPTIDTFLDSQNRDLLNSNVGFIPYLCRENQLVLPLDAKFSDGIPLVSLRQRNFGADVFTTAMTSAQYGQAQSVAVTGNRFTIEALRQANALQQFEERNNIASPRLQDYVKVNYGADLSSGVAQRTILLGSCQFDAYTHGINQTGVSGSNSNNPFDCIGTEYGKMRTSGSNMIIRGFTASEPGYIMVIGSLVPRVTYSYFVDPMFERYTVVGSQTDMANPILQCTGNEAVPTTRLGIASSRIFGFVERYAFWKTKQDSVHGLFRHGESLSSFVAQRALRGEQSISTKFLEIPVDYLSSVSAVGSDVSRFGVLAECMFDYKVAMPLSAYTIPSLENPAVEHGDTITVKRDGSHL